MDLNLFEQIEEFNSPDYLFNKFNQNNMYNDPDNILISLHQSKKAFFFVFGKKIKKKFLYNLLINQNTNNTLYFHSEYYLRDVYITKDNFKYLFNSIKNNPEINLISNHDLIFEFYNYISYNNFNINQNITINNFKNKIKEKFPNLNNNLIEEIFYILDKDRDGILRLSDFEIFLI